MNYHSTRTKNNLVDSAEAVIQGITPDGGLFVPQQVPQLD
ncbi:MAG: hypothetical protein MJ060_04785 [Clostridia bacterium]|nr:hypothetical protein [Clostridia bacterium]